MVTPEGLIYHSPLKKHHLRDAFFGPAIRSSVERRMVDRPGRSHKFIP